LEGKEDGNFFDTFLLIGLRLEKGGRRKAIVKS